MAPDSFSGPGPAGDSNVVSEVTQVGWLQRVKQAFAGALIGGVLIVIACIVLFHNEAQEIRSISALRLASHQVVDISPDTLNAAAEGKLVHVTGQVETSAPARDPLLGATGSGLLRLRRTVEMFQWKQDTSTRTQKALGGSETRTTTYTYTKVWSAAPIDSSGFHDPSGHENPSMGLRTVVFDSDSARLGAYRLSTGVLDKISNFTPIEIAPGWGRDAGYKQVGSFLYRGNDLDNPAIGDLRVSFDGVLAQTMSIVAALAGSTLTPLHTPGGYTIALAEAGAAPAAVMFREKVRQVRRYTWILRGVGLLLMFIGFMLMAQPLAVIAGVIPLLQSLVEAGAFIAALILALPATLLVIALAWLAYRPLASLALVLAGVALAVMIRRLSSSGVRPSSTHATAHPG